MSTQTTNLNLTQPALGDKISDTIPALGTNFGTIDSEFGLGGTTANRPTTGLYTGRRYYDTTVGMPIYWNGTIWTDEMGRTPAAPMTDAPTTGAWQVGDYVRNALPAAGGNRGWVCTSTNPLTWYPCDLISTT